MITPAPLTALVRAQISTSISAVLPLYGGAERRNSGLVFTMGGWGRASRKNRVGVFRQAARKSCGVVLHGGGAEF